MKINICLLLFCVIFTFFVGSFFSFFINTEVYTILNVLVQVPSLIFPIVWSILYLLLGISVYIILINNSKIKKTAIKYYLLQLIINSIWTLVFFGFSLYILSFILIILLIIFVLLMIKEFYKINKFAVLINIFYLLWIIFAGVLNLSIILLN